MYKFDLGIAEVWGAVANGENGDLVLGGTLCKDILGAVIDGIEDTNCKNKYFEYLHIVPNDELHLLGSERLSMCYGGRRGRCRGSARIHFNDAVSA